MNRITSYRMNATIVGTAGTAKSDGSLPRGKILAVEIKYPSHDVNVNLTTKNLAVTQTVLDLGASHANIVLYPRTIAQTSAGASMIYDAGAHTIPVEFTTFGSLILTLSGGTDADIVTVIVYVEEQ